MAPLPLDWLRGGQQHWHKDVTFLLSSCRQYHGVWAMEVGGKVPYGWWYLFLWYVKRKKDQKLCWYIFIVSRTTTSQVNHDNKIAVVHCWNPESVKISLVRLQGHKNGATRNHELPEATLDPKGARADHSAISAWRTDCNQSVWVNSVGAAWQPLWVGTYPWQEQFSFVRWPCFFKLAFPLENYSWKLNNFRARNGPKTHVIVAERVVEEELPLLAFSSASWAYQNCQRNYDFTMPERKVVTIVRPQWLRC